MSSDHHDDHDHIHPAPTTFLSKYVFTIDHKVIALQFLFASIFFVFIGGLLALGVRYQIAWPGQNVPFSALTPGNNKTFKEHQVGMTSIAGETNLALWQLSGPVILGPAGSGGEVGDPADDLAVVDGKFVRRADIRPDIEKQVQAEYQEILKKIGKANGLITADGEVTPEIEAKIIKEHQDALRKAVIEADFVRKVNDETIKAFSSKWVDRKVNLKWATFKERYPGGTGGEFTGFPDALACYLKAGTYVTVDDGEQFPLGKATKVRINPSYVLGGYKATESYNLETPANPVYESAPYGLINAGVKAVEELEDGTAGRTFKVVKGTIYRPAEGGISTPEYIYSGINVPIRSDVTNVAFDLTAQQLTVRGKPERLYALVLTDEQRKSFDAVFDPILQKISDQKKVVEDQEKALKDATQARDAIDAEQKPEEFNSADQLVKEQDEKLKAEQAKLTRHQQELAITEVDVPVLPGTFASAPRSFINYEKNTLDSGAYLTLFTMHATIMVFFVLMPTLLGTFANFLIPLMIGARDMAFPKLNMLSFWISVPSGIVMLASFWVIGGASGGGWTMYPPHSVAASYGQGLGATLWLVSIALVGFSTIVGTLNYITTVLNMRAPGMTLFRMPLTIWSLFITAILGLFATPVLTAAGFMLLFDRILGTMFFLPIAEATMSGEMREAGGQPLLWQHLFWFFGHPEVYILILPAMGIASDVLAVHARKPIFGYKPMVFAMAAISILGFIVWGHHMFQSGMNPTLGTTFMAATIMIAVPSAIKTFNWLGTLWGGDIRFTPPMLFGIGFVAMFVIGGLSGIFMAAAPVDISLHDTYFIVAHIHYVFFGGTLLGVFAGIYQWFPKMFGRQLDPRWGKIHFFLTIIGLNGTFFLMHVLGIGGHPRRYASIMEYPSLEHLQPMNVFMTICAMMLGMSQIPFLYNLFRSMPLKLTRALLMLYAVLGGGATIIGMTFWGGFDGGIGELLFGHHGKAGAIEGQFAYTFNSLQTVVGFVLILAACAGIVYMLVTQLPRGGKIAGALSGGAVIALVLLVFSYWGALPQLESRIAEATAAHDGLNAWWLTTVSWLFDLIVAVGLSLIYMAFAVAVVFAIFEVGKIIRLHLILDKVMWIMFLPLFLMPVIVKKETYMWLGLESVFPETWMAAIFFLVVLSIPTILYLVVFRPKDAYGEYPGENPWNANSLEWMIPSPPPHYNFEEIPTVHRGPYEYNTPVAEDDFLPQPEELPPGVVEPTGH